MSITFDIGTSERVYVERIDINGNTVTRDKVIRREFRLAEGDPFSSLRVKRSRDRIQSLGFFQDNLEVTQTQGSAADRVILGVDVEEKSTGELQLSAGFSSLERFLINLSVVSATSWARARSCAPESTIPASPSRSNWASPSPICSTATSPSASTCSGATLRASTSSTTTATRRTSR
jgi:hypothetical protein